MTDDERKAEALFRLQVIGSLTSRELTRGELDAALKELAAQTWTGPDGRARTLSWRTLEEWYYAHRRAGFEGLLRQPRTDRGSCRAIGEDLRELVLALKREDPGRSASQILRELEGAGRVRQGEVSLTTLRRVLRRAGLSGPKLELDRPVRLRWQAAECGELWQADAVHGPKLHDPRAGREVRVKIFALLDDRSRLVAYARGGFQEGQADFLTVLLGAVQRRGIPRVLLVDNHSSFTGADTQVACARLGIRLTFARPHDGPAKGKIERFWRTLRAQLLDRLDPERVKTLDDLNLRLSTWIESEYNHRAHEGLGGRAPHDVWEDDAERVRWVEDPALLEAAFTASLQRRVKNDSTVQVQGRTYEVPCHLRGQTVRMGYALLRPEVLWVEDGPTRVPVREVEPEANAERSRRAPAPDEPEPRPRTGMNAVEDLLRRVARPLDRPSSGGEGNHVA